MELTFGWLSAAVGLAGSTLSCILAGRAASCIPEPIPASRKANLYAGALLLLIITLICWLVSTRTTPPFSRGQSLGLGFLIGGGASVVALLESRRTGAKCVQGALRSRALALLSMSFFSVFVASMVYVLFSSYPQNAMLGLAIGACMGGIVSRLMSVDGNDFSPLLMDVFSATTVLLSTGTLLSVAHFGQDTTRIWWPLPVLLGATSAAAAFIGIEIASFSKSESKPGLQVFAASAIAAIVAFSLSAVYASKITQDMQLLKVAGASAVIWGLIAWQTQSAKRHSQEYSFEAAAIVYSLVLAFLVAAFKLWSGLGIAVGLTVGLSIIIPVLAVKDNHNNGLLSSAFYTAIAAVLYRLFIEYYSSNFGRGDVRVHYTMIGAMVAAIMAMLLVVMISRSVRISSSTIWNALSTGVIGLFAAGLPLVIMLVWDTKAVLGLVFGVIFALAMLGFASQCTGKNLVSETLKKIPLLLIGAQLVALQFVGPILTTEATRTVRIWILAISGAIFVVWMVILDVLAAKKGGEPCSVDQS